jgi:hypothetical protein
MVMAGVVGFQLWGRPGPLPIQRLVEVLAERQLSRWDHGHTRLISAAASIRDPNPSHLSEGRLTVGGGGARDRSDLETQCHPLVHGIARSKAWTFREEVGHHERDLWGRRRTSGL